MFLVKVCLTKKIIAFGNTSKRNFVAYISEPNLGVLPTPEIKDVELKAYNAVNNEIFPWYEEGTKLVASYEVSDKNIFQKKLCLVLFKGERW